MENVFRRFVSKISIYNSTDELFALCRSTIQSGKSLSISFLNAHGFNVACRNDRFSQSVMDTDIVLRDGIGVKILYKLLKKDPGLNLNGTDLIPKLLEHVFKNERIAIFGSAEAELNIVRNKLSNNGYNIVGTVDGFQSDETYVQKVSEMNPTLVIIAMGMPKQECMARLLCQHFDHISTISGGAIIDFMAGKVARAPAWMRKIGLEWVYRLLQEPKRLFKRYVIGNALFMGRALFLLRKPRSFS